MHQLSLDVLPPPRPAPRPRRPGSTCRTWLPVCPAWPGYGGRSRLVCVVAGEHERHTDRAGWSWVSGDRLPSRVWQCNGRDPLTGRAAHSRPRVVQATEDAVRVQGWHVGWWGERPDPLCPDCTG